MNVDIGVTAQASFLHFAIGNLQLAEQQAQLFQIRLGFFWTAQLRLADDFQERRAGPVQIDQAFPTAALLVV